MKTLEDFEDYMTMFAPDIPEQYISHAVREAVIAFMRDSKLAVDKYIFTYEKKVTDYILDIPEDRQLVAIDHVVAAGRMLQNTPDYELYTYDSDQDGYPYIEFSQDNYVKAGDTIAVHYSWAIDRDGCLIPDFIYQKYMDAIKHYTLMQLYLVPNTEWVSPDLSNQYGQKYAEDLKSAIARKRGGARRMGGHFLGRKRDRRGLLWH